MINKWYEISCDTCGCAEHFTGSIKNAEGQARDVGWIIKAGRHFDNENCYKKARTEA